jgi:hypothetical protein
MLWNGVGPESGGSLCGKEGVSHGGMNESGFRFM